MSEEIKGVKIIDSFLTGSRVYGTPRADSDLDLAILVEDASTLWNFKTDGDSTCRFGKLNLITFTVKDNFDKWKKVTEELKKRAPVTRDEAVAAFQAQGFGNYGEKS